MRFEDGKALSRIISETLSELIFLIKDSSIIRISLTRLFKGLAGFLRIVFHIEVSNSQVSPNSRKFRVKLSGSLPMLDCLTMAFTVVEKIAQVVWRSGILRAYKDCLLQYLHLFQQARKNISWTSGCGMERTFESGLALSAQTQNQRLRVEFHCRGTGV